MNPRPAHTRPHLTAPTVLLTAFLAVTTAHAQAATSITLPAAVASALTAGSTVRDAQAGVTSAASTLRAVQADPSTLAGALLSAQQDSTLAQAQLTQARLTATQNAVTAYTALYQTQEQITLQQLQIQVDTKNLQVAQVKLSTRNGTALDVQNAQNTLNSSRQALQDAQAQLLVNSQKLANVIGRPGTYTAAAPATPPAVRANTTLSSTYAALLKDRQAVETATLNVKLADNEFTARVTLDQARTTLASAQSTLATDQKTYLTTLATAQSSAEAAQASYQTALQAEANAQTSYKQDAVRLQSGTISAVALLQSQLTLKKAQYARAQALVALWQSLAALSTASGQDATGLAR
ncbi:TolC family protein [Deinococcus aquiradiocola]|uniref:Transporter n=1 Tax=Deinococcus aquiradiocola TaxID=393059 RepID=A0A917PHY6_9DEIO|nr:TolC family protein [Deinococcus aquiradiocola]GGJ79627.1 transporter [Deinococcus aquiradiocola]